MNEQNMLPKATVGKRRKFSIIWLIPLIAIGIGLWLIYQTVAERGIPITITFKNGEGVESKKTFIRYKGVLVGEVDSIELGPDLKEVIVKATLDKSAAGLAKEGADYWVVRPQVGPGGITGLDTLVSGVYIAASPGSGKPAKEFQGLEEPQLGSKNAPGINIILETDELNSVRVGSPIYYRKIQIGEIEHFDLAKNSESVKIYVHISDKYAPLVRKNSKFWSVSGIKMSANILGTKITTESLEAVLAGGVAFRTPGNKNMGPEAKDGAVFKLHKNSKSSWLRWKPDIQLKKKKK